MSQIRRGQTVDATLQAIRGALRQYEAKHPQARVQVKRQNPVSVRVRVLDPGFEGLDRSTREDQLWVFLDTLAEDVRADITMLLLLTPEEAEMSLANAEFDNPISSRL
jgi:hypothetical protein